MRRLKALESWGPARFLSPGVTAGEFVATEEGFAVRAASITEDGVTVAGVAAVAGEEE